MEIRDVICDPEFESFLPPLSAEEKAALRADIEANGITDPIIVWQHHGEIVDGYNRYRLWQELGSFPKRAPEIIEKKFPDRAAVMEWMFKRQSGRRNWTAAQKAATALKMKPAIEAKAAENKTESGKHSGRGKVSTNSSKPISPVDTRKEIAAIAGVSEDTVRKTEAVLEHGTSEVKAAMQAGEISANAAFNQTKNNGKPRPQTEPTEEEDGPDRTNPATEKQIAKAGKLLAKVVGSINTTNDTLGPLVCAFDEIKAADANFGNRHRALLAHHKRLFDAMAEAKKAVSALNAAWVRK